MLGTCGDSPLNQFVKSQGIPTGGTKGERRSASSQAPPLLLQRKPYLTGSPPSRQKRRCRQECRVPPSISRVCRVVSATVPITLSYRRQIGGGLSPKFFSEFGFSRRTLVPDANRFPGILVCMAVLSCWTWRILTFSTLPAFFTFTPFSTLPPGVARLSRISNLPLLAGLSRVPRLAGLTRLSLRSRWSLRRWRWGQAATGN